MVAFFMLVLVLSLVSAILGIQIQESIIALRVKQVLFLEQPYSKRLFALSRFKTWRRMLGTAFYLLLPLVLFFVVVMRLHIFISDLLDCPYYTSFHITWMLLFFYMGLPIITSLVLAPLGIFGVYIIESLRR